MLADSASSTMVKGRPTNKARTKPPVSGTADSFPRPSPTRRAAIACTPDDSPITNAVAMKATNEPVPTPARASVPKKPTMAVSTRLSTVCDIMAPTRGNARWPIRLSRERSISDTR